MRIMHSKFPSELTPSTLSTTKYVLMSQIETNMSNFHPFEVVDRDSETQLHVGENLCC